MSKDNGGPELTVASENIDFKESSELDAESSSFVWLFDALHTSWQYMHECAAQSLYAYRPSMYPVFLPAEAIRLPGCPQLEHLPAMLEIPATASDEIRELKAESEQFSRAYGLLNAENQSLQSRVAELEKDAARWKMASTSRNFGITDFNEFGVRTIYDGVAALVIDAAMGEK